MPGTINPYNFVPLSASEPQRSPYPGLRSLRPEAYSGIVECRLVCLGPLVSVDHRSHEMYQLRDQVGNPATNRYGQAKRPIKLFKFLCNSAGAPIVQAASLKGMVRAVYEAIEDACLVLAATKGVSNKSSTQKIPYHYKADNYAHDNCNAPDKLCAACRLFGGGDSLHCQGRVLFTDATLLAGTLVPARHFLRELSSPKPHHDATYSRSGRPGEIAGRKFYYHHKLPPAFSVLEPDCTDRSSAVDEHAPGGTKFSFQVHISDLDAPELGGLLLALELERGLGHKLGMGKAIGLGSARIEVDVAKSRVWQPKDRYRTADPRAACGAPALWYNTKAKLDLDRVRHSRLYELLRLDKPDDGDIAYPVGTGYPKDRMDARGRFGGSAMTSRDPESPEEQVNEPIGPPPVVGPDEQAAWLKAVFKDEMLLVTADNKEARRPYSAFQAKKSLLVVGKWYVLSGTKSVKAPRGR